MDNVDIILSLTRTTRVGYLRDLRRLTVALSRARLGLYILGRRAVFESCYELRDAFSLLLRRPDKLALVTGELWPSKRLLADETDDTKKLEGEVVMEGVEHLGQWVFEMTKTKIAELRKEKGLSEEVPVEMPKEVVSAEADEGYLPLDEEEGDGEEGEGERVKGFEIEDS